MKKLVEKFLRDEQGLELSEYAVMSALIILAVVLAVTALGGAISDAFTTLKNTIAGGP